MENFQSFSKNRQTSKLGGVAIAVRNDDTSSYLKVGEGKDNDEYLIVRNSTFNPALNIVSFYGGIESRSRIEETNVKWERFLNDLV